MQWRRGAARAERQDEDQPDREGPPRQPASCPPALRVVGAGGSVLKGGFGPFAVEHVKNVMAAQASGVELRLKQSEER